MVSPYIKFILAFSTLTRLCMPLIAPLIARIASLQASQTPRAMSLSYFN
jgi:hypothetical protein